MRVFLLMLKAMIIRRVDGIAADAARSPIGLDHPKVGTPTDGDDVGHERRRRAAATGAVPRLLKESLGRGLPGAIVSTGRR